MNLNTKYTIIGCVLLLVMLITMGTSCGAVPYSAMTRSYSIVEGARNRNRNRNPTITYRTNKKENFSHNLKVFIRQLQAMIKLNVYPNLIADLQPILDLIKQPVYTTKDVKSRFTDIQTRYDTNSKIYGKIQTFIEQYIDPLIEAADKAPHVVTQGFTTMSDVEPMIDIYSSAVGDLNCVKTASGLSNSNGPLCLSEEQLYMLQSRGGNSSGLDSQIG